VLNRTLIILLFVTSTAFGQDKGMFVISREYRNRTFPERVTIVVDWKKLQRDGDFDLTDGNFGKRVTKKVVDINSDGQADALVFDYVFESDEPLYSFSVKPNGKSIAFTTSNATADPRLKVIYLTNKKDVVSWPDKIIASVMSLNPEPGYDTDFAFFLNAMFVRYNETHNEAYFNYIKKWADRFIDTHGYLNPKIYNVAHYKLDDLLPGRIFIRLYEVTKDQRYKGAAQQLRQQLQYQPRTSDGGFWHQQNTPYQMWLNDAYTGGTFLMHYANVFKEPKLFDQAMEQLNLIKEHNGDPETGLMYHGWDESGNHVWANEDTGTSKEFWSQGIGWYYISLLECIEYIPLESMDRKLLGPMFRELTKPVQKFQDKQTSLWYEVTNKSYEPRNWTEAAGSAMLAYGFAKGSNRGIFDKTYLASAQKVFESIQREWIFFDDEGRLYLDGTVKNATLNTKLSKGDLDYYVSAERRINDFKGLGALLYLVQELD
jgi:unsaturated rhamnogalacturonyl hydrolase